jgi:hypothetical protein
MKNKKMILAIGIILILLFTGIAYSADIKLPTFDQVTKGVSDLAKQGTQLFNGAQQIKEKRLSANDEYQKLIEYITKYNELTPPKTVTDFSAFYKNKKKALDTIIISSKAIITDIPADITDEELKKAKTESERIKKEAENIRQEIIDFEAADKKDTKDQTADGIDKQGGFFWTDKNFNNKKITLPTGFDLTKEVETTGGGWDPLAGIKKWTKIGDFILKNWVLILIGVVVVIALLVYIFQQIMKKGTDGIIFVILLPFKIIGRLLNALWQASTKKVETPAELKGWNKIIRIIIEKLKIFLALLFLGKKKLEAMKKQPKTGPQQKTQELTPEEKDIEKKIKQIQKNDEQKTKAAENAIEAIELRTQGKISAEEFLRRINPEDNEDVQKKDAVELVKLKTREAEILEELSMLNQEWETKKINRQMMDYKETYEKTKKALDEELIEVKKKITSISERVGSRIEQNKEPGIRERRVYTTDPEEMHEDVFDEVFGTREETMISRPRHDITKDADNLFNELYGTGSQEKKKITIKDKIKKKIEGIKIPKKQEKPATTEKPKQTETPEGPKESGLKKIFKQLW